ncbi:ABC transporter permease, partial [Candidatus Bathyarchaeota archaeon]
PEYRGLPASELNKIIEDRLKHEIERLGLDQPFLIRSFRYLYDALTLNLGRAMYMTSDSGSRQVKLIILERLPQTVLLFTTATVLNFVIHMFLGLYLSRNYGSFFDKLVIALAPTSSIPGWFYGIFLIMIFASWLHLLPYGGLVDYPPPEDPFLYALSVLKHMILPLSSWVIANFFLGIYSSRTFFLIFSTEDYVEVAKAKGLPPRDIEIRYILRPSLPPIITSLALSLIASWGGAIITETVFNWPGLGLVTYQAIQYFDVPVIVGITVIYAYLLAATVLILDIIYGILDPRIKAGGG